MPYNKPIICDAERVGQNMEMLSNNDKISFVGYYPRTNEESYSGEYSAKLSAADYPYSFGCEFNDIRGDDYILVRYKKKGPQNSGLVIIELPEHSIYHGCSNFISYNADGWSTFESNITIPPDISNSLVKIYIWNKDTIPIFVDDIEITRYKSKPYPVFTGDHLRIFVDKPAFRILNFKRIQAFELGILLTEDNDWVNAVVSDSNLVKPARIRLKGDLMDHLIGTKWSFRIKLNKEFAWKKLRTFSIQSPDTRGLMAEYIAHKLFDREGVLTTRYFFIPVHFNHNNLGMYAVEEHFEKHLIESRNKRDGPILKFSEDQYWIRNVLETGLVDYHDLPYYVAATILPFKLNTTLKDSVRINQFKIGQDLMYQYKWGLEKPSSIFDINAMGKYLALTDILSATHSLVWHNQRFYFNPITCKLEPIIFDCYTETGIFNRFNRATTGLFNPDQLSLVEKFNMQIMNLFRDSLIFHSYLSYLAHYSDSSFISEFINEYQNEFDSLTNILYTEFPGITYDPNFILQNAENIRQNLPLLKSEAPRITSHEYFHLFETRDSIKYDTVFHPSIPEKFIEAYLYSEKHVDSVTVFNYSPYTITVLGSGNKNRIDYFIHPELLILPYRESYLKPGKNIIHCEGAREQLYFIVNGRFETYNVPIYPWPFPGGKSPRQLLGDKGFDSLQTSNVVIDKKQKTIRFMRANHLIDDLYLIPAGYRIMIEAGAKIELAGFAGLISLSPFSINGKENDSVYFYGLDSTNFGLSVLTTNVPSIVSYTAFHNINNLNYIGWEQTGGVNFYESEVNLLNCSFSNNQCEDALNIIRSNFIIEGCRFDHIYGDGFDSDFCEGKLSGSSFTNIGNDAIDFSGSRILIKDCSINDIGDKGISGGEKSFLFIEDVRIDSANIGVASKDLSKLNILNCTISECNYGIALFQKKPEYGPSRMIMNNTTIVSSSNDYILELNSILIKDRDTIYGSKFNVGELFY